jgi:hypothetical protein
MLGWRAFQDLAQVVLREVLGQQLEVYSDSRDVGQDGAFAGQATPVVTGQLTGIHGEVVAQMKYRTRAGARLAASDINDELPKVERLVTRGRCDSYILLTNALVSGKVAATVKEELHARGVDLAVVLGGEWLSQTIRDSPRLRALVPRVYGLGDLSQILDERIYAQTQALLESLKNDLATFVVTDGYGSAVDALERHGFVLLLGEPGAGKTVTAATIAAAASDLWGLRVAQINYPSAMRHWNPNEPQLLWADDAFGPMNLNPALMDPWNRTLSLVRAIVSNRSRIILTSRDYIWRAARRYLKESSFPFLIEDRVTINVTSFSSVPRRNRSSTRTCALGASRGNSGQLPSRTCARSARRSTSCRRPPVASRTRSSPPASTLRRRTTSSGSSPTPGSTSRRSSTSSTPHTKLRSRSSSRTLGGCRVRLPRHPATGT